MRNSPNLKIEQHRIGGPPRTNCGAFLIRIPKFGVELQVIAGNGMGWDHVSVRGPGRVPTYEEMEFVRELFFKDDEAVMQLSVARADHINIHPLVLHLWRPQTQGEILREREAWGDEWAWGDLQASSPIPIPPKECV